MPGIGQQYPQLLLTSRQSTPALATAAADQRDGLRQTVAALYAGHGGGIDGPCLDAARGVAVSRAAVAAASRGVSEPSGGKQAEEGA